MRATPLVLVALALGVGTAPTQAQLVAKNTCVATKTKCVTTQVAALLKCYAKAARKGLDPATDPKTLQCLQTAATKFGGGPAPAQGCFAKVEAKAKPAKPETLCVTTNDTGVLGATATAFVADVVGQLTDAPPPVVCGDGVIAGSEQCDFGNLDGKTCATQGLFGDGLACTPGTCTFDTSGCFATRFVNNGDGTVTDRATRLQWEQKATGSPGKNFADPHDVDNTYTWSTGGIDTPPDGTVFTDFLATLNGGVTGVGNCVSPAGSTQTGGFAGHCDWRLPTIEELRTIVDTTVPGCGSGSPCIDPIFGPTAFGPTTAFSYWSATTPAGFTFRAWYVYFSNGNVSHIYKDGGLYVRAVRIGS